MPKITQSVAAAITVTLLLVTPAIAQLGPNSGSNLFGGGRPQPLPIDQAFPFFVSINNPQSLSVSWQIAAGHYLYRHQFGFALKRDADSNAQSLQFSLPEGLQKQDQFFGDIEAYYENVTATVQLDFSEFPNGRLVIQYQGCADWGFCYPPQSVEYPLNP